MLWSDGIVAKKNIYKSLDHALAILPIYAIHKNVCERECLTDALTKIICIFSVVQTHQFYRFAFCIIVSYCSVPEILNFFCEKFSLS